MSTNTKIILFVVFAFILFAAITLALWWQGYETVTDGLITQPEALLPAGDTTDVINQGIEAIELPDLDSEFESLDQDINQL